MSQKISIMIYISFMIFLTFHPVNSEMCITHKLIQDGNEKMILMEQYKNITFILGNPVSGKSTFLQWIVGDELISREVEGKTGEFIIENSNLVGNSTEKSDSLFPKLVVDNKTNTAYYDFPGFSDTRSDGIAGIYFTKKLTDHADGLKIILVAAYPTVSDGIDRKDFMKLIKHATGFIKNVEKFQNSIAMVVTKVENPGYFDDKLQQFIVIPDENIIRNIASFFKNVKMEIEEKLKSPNLNPEKGQFYKSAIKLLDALVMKNNENYARIGIFRRPNQPGPLSNISLLEEGKKGIKQMIQERLQFAVKNVDDFDYKRLDESLYMQLTDKSKICS